MATVIMYVRPNNTPYPIYSMPNVGNLLTQKYRSEIIEDEGSEENSYACKIIINYMHINVH